MREPYAQCYSYLPYYRGVEIGGGMETLEEINKRRVERLL